MVVVRFVRILGVSQSDSSASSESHSPATHSDSTCPAYIGVEEGASGKVVLVKFCGRITTIRWTTLDENLILRPDPVSLLGNVVLVNARKTPINLKAPKSSNPANLSHSHGGDQRILPRESRPRTRISSYRGKLLPQVKQSKINYRLSPRKRDTFTGDKSKEKVELFPCDAARALSARNRGRDTATAHAQRFYAFNVDPKNLVLQCQKPEALGN
ncbi:hypothetical protein B0H17DRAFT_1127735 [Mycena rosella]|uniref:Uncharacterized protein n=1 Tax=Mycena rosella TaxID=1033263 RepID=A0AAD7DZZ5_MYCRO|nr:hypothetical protein B0H17DRAFT_1127735 [Mycena rosella]